MKYLFIGFGLLLFASCTTNTPDISTSINELARQKATIEDLLSRFSSTCKANTSVQKEGYALYENASRRGNSLIESLKNLSINSSEFSSKKSNYEKAIKIQAAHLDKGLSKFEAFAKNKIKQACNANDGSLELKGAITFTPIIMSLFDKLLREKQGAAVLKQLDELKMTPYRQLIK